MQTLRRTRLPSLLSISSTFNLCSSTTSTRGSNNTLPLQQHFLFHRHLNTHCRAALGRTHLTSSPSGSTRRARGSRRAGAECSRRAVGLQRARYGAGGCHNRAWRRRGGPGQRPRAQLRPPCRLRPAFRFGRRQGGDDGGWRRPWRHGEREENGAGGRPERGSEEPLRERQHDGSVQHRRRGKP
jgi:hypothetical protein